MNYDEIWSAALAKLLKEVGDDDPKSVFLNLLKPHDIVGDRFILDAQNEQVTNWVKNNYLTEMDDALSAAAGYKLVAEVRTASEDSFYQKPTQQSPQHQMNTPVEPADETPLWEPVTVSSLTERKADGAQQGTETTPVVPSTTSGQEALFAKSSFDTFIVGDSNKFAHSVAVAVAEQPGFAYNPLFIYGNSGLGKTHLLVSIANYVMKNFPSMITRYVPASQFLDDLVNATLNHQFSTFNAKYHHVDILLVDDVQYLENREESTTQLFNIFNEMIDHSKQIVLSADRPPKDIKMEDRMLSRFMSGVLADIKPPDYETRLAILMNYRARLSQQSSYFGTLSDDVLNYIADIATSNVREMEGAVTKVVSMMNLLQVESFTVDEVEDILKDFFPDIENRKITIGDIQGEVERFFQVSHEDMISPKRSKDIKTARHIAIYLSRYLTEESLESIGKQFGGRDHTTVMHSVSKIEREQKDNRSLYDQIEQLSKKIKKRG